MVDGAAGLKRKIGLWGLLLYGLGNILGAGIYVLVGKVAGAAGAATTLSFLLASAGVAFTVFSYAELAARYPISAGEAVYVHEAFGFRGLSIAVGLLLALAGVSSSATIAHGFAGYFQVFFPISTPWLIAVLILVLGALAAWGIGESVKIVGVLTLLEVLGLVLVIGVGGASLWGSKSVALPDQGDWQWTGVVMGAFLAFYAFIGFEDMVNVAEEVKNPERTLPRAALLALAIATCLYSLVSVIAVKVVPASELAESAAPLALVVERSGLTGTSVIVLISLCAVVNGALIQLIMVARILYGMARQGWLPPALARVNRRTSTPLLATSLAVGACLLFALVLPLLQLAELTSFFVLLVFVLVNAALIVLKRRLPAVAGAPSYPAWVPWCGLAVSVLFILGRVLLPLE